MKIKLGDSRILRLSFFASFSFETKRRDVITIFERIKLLHYSAQQDDEKCI